ncbi:MAG: 2-phosphosulfolactate phosphatase [Chloroflexota bacterium]|nr:2-phosphosulfolactate phosphatase [Chloroflexota bacterium]
MEEAVGRGEVVLVVDTLRFSSTAVAAAHAGVRLLPLDARREEARETAARLGLPVVGSSRTPGSRPDVPTDSPLWYTKHGRAGSAYVYASPNGARLTSLAGWYPHMYVGAFLNASAVAAAAAGAARGAGMHVCVVAAGERSTDFYPQAAPRRLFAVEDWLAAGAIAAGTRLELSPEARVAASAYESCRRELGAVLRECLSGLWLVESGRGEEVDFCARVDALPVVAVVREGWIVAQGDS